MQYVGFRKYFKFLQLKTGLKSFHTEEKKQFRPFLEFVMYLYNNWRFSVGLSVNPRFFLCRPVDSYHKEGFKLSCRKIGAKRYFGIIYILFHCFSNLFQIIFQNYSYLLFVFRPNVDVWSKKRNKPTLRYASLINC